MNIHNTLTKKIEEFRPLDGNKVRIYSCGPTVYNHIHIGNLSAFIAADTLRRTLVASGYEVKHIMNFTDVDDKTIRRSQEQDPDNTPEEALKKLTHHYEQIFLDDMVAIGNDAEAIMWVKATENINKMQELIRQLYKYGFAYIADDGIYFSIEKYRASGKTYGQLLTLDAKNTSEARIDNDEYDKESVHDFALWKMRKDSEPAWEFELDGHDLLGRPGWHIECSAMSVDNLGQPFDIHTGGVDLIFPHHENEIAQSTAGQSNPIYAKYFVHNEHLLVDGKKMSKSLNNFFTLEDIKERGFDPLAFRLMILQAHYRSQTNFTWENLEAAQNRLKSFRSMADLRWQLDIQNRSDDINFKTYESSLVKDLQNNLDTPHALSNINSHLQIIEGLLVNKRQEKDFLDYLETIDNLLGLKLLGSKDILDEQKDTILKRKSARDKKEWTESDELRDKLKEQGIGLRDTPHGQIWYRF